MSPRARRSELRHWAVSATTNAIALLADELAEDTSRQILVKSHVRLLAPVRLLACVARADDLASQRPLDVKQVPGWPKTLGSPWAGEAQRARHAKAQLLAAAGCVTTPSCRSILVGQRSREKRRVEKPLEGALITVSAVSTEGVPGRLCSEHEDVDFDQ
jgi:hypothetical protein